MLTSQSSCIVGKTNISFYFLQIGVLGPYQRWYLTGAKLLQYSVIISSAKRQFQGFGNVLSDFLLMRHKYVRC